jgi:hypothetical protein
MALTNRRTFRYARQSTAPLARNEAHQFAAAHAMSIYQAQAVYSFIPKNACSTLRYSIALANGCISDDTDVNWIHNNNETFRATLAELATARYSFVILRDPFRRIASCFLDKFVDRRPEAWRYVEALGHTVDLAQLTFRQFVTGASRCLRADQHWRPQIDFLVYEQYDDWYCVEDFDRAIATLDSKIGFLAKDTRDLLRHGTEQYRIVASSEHFSDVRSLDIANLKQQGQIPTVESLFDDEIIHLMRSMYGDDFMIYEAKIGRPCLFG